MPSPQQLKDWFKNHTRASAGVGETKRKLFDWGPKKAKKMPLVQVYSKMFYETRLKDIIQESWNQEYLATHPMLSESDKCRIPVPSLKFRNKMTKTLFAEEPRAVQLEVERKQGTMLAEEGDESAGEGDDLDLEDREKQQALSFQQCVPFFFPVVCIS